MAKNLTFSNAAPFKYYKTASAMLDDIKKADAELDAAGKQRSYTSSMSSEQDGWYQTESLEEADSFLMGGWEYGASAMTEALDIIGSGKDSGIFESALLENDVTGAVCDVGAYVTGDPECMLTTNTPAQESVITICVNTVQAGCISGEQMLWRGAAIVALVQALEARGHRTRIICYDIAPTEKRWAGWVLSLKEPGDRFNINTIAYALANPSMMRRHSFRWAETVAYDWQMNDALGYGRIAELDEIEGMGALTDDVDFYVTRFIGIADTLEGARDSVMEAAREAGLIQ